MSGVGRRFVEVGYTAPKPLIEVDGKPIIEHVLNLFPGVEDVSFICNSKHLQETNMRSLLLRLKPECKIYEVPVGEKKGPVDAVYHISDFIDDNKKTIVSYCDYGSSWDFKKFIDQVSKNDTDGCIACYTGFHPHMLGNDNYAFAKVVDGKVVQVKEKQPFTNNKMDEYASNGTYYFKSGRILKKYFKELLASGNTTNDEYYVSLVYNHLINDGLAVSVFEISQMLQWGTPYDLEIYKGWSRYFKNLTKPQKSISNPHGTTLLLPMAGRGSRFSETGYDLPKPLLDIDGKPMVVQAVSCLPKSDNNIFICLAEHIDSFNIDSILKENFLNTSIIKITEVTKGQACTCEIGIELGELDLEKPVLISACDNGVYYDSQKYQDLLDDTTIDVIVWSFRNNQTSKINPNAYAWLKVDENDNILNVSCKNFIYDDPLKTHAIIGTMFFRKAKYFIDGLKKNYEKNITTNGEYYVDDVLNQNIKSGLKIKVFETENYICWGTPNDYKTYHYWQTFFDKCEWHPYKNNENRQWRHDV